MELQVLGIGDAFTSRHYNTSFLVRSQQAYLVDAPQALFRLLAERGLDPAEINDVIVTHVHGDHVSGLETLMLWKRYVQGRRLKLYTSDAVYRDLRDKFFPSFAETFEPDLMQIVPTVLEDYVEHVRLETSRATRLDSELEVESRENWHPVPTLGLKFRGPRGSIGISGDTCYQPELLRGLRDRGTLSEERYQRLVGDWLWSSDLIYHDVARRAPSPHTLEADLLALPEETRRKIRLVHMADNFTEQELRLAREGEIVNI